MCMWVQVQQNLRTVGRRRALVTMPRADESAKPDLLEAWV